MTWSMAWLFLALAACMHSAGFAVRGSHVEVGAVLAQSLRELYLPTTYPQGGVATNDASKWIILSKDVDSGEDPDKYASCFLAGSSQFQQATGPER
ncbi:hypothetical protein CPAR01_15147 [Colletotrichum paranaense]|uniref:Uncharacterized protein n=1 Tax=Colletotrichum paranaense TaxID=1914294 RepID=A0ABQ9RZK4_9PEZI|nr:uncharacterized protein CPAR01_15147 [Colletotrichum paranaense]KAK1520096.1 hypothetical protein CPAR01_15147 [Colletotrichum paranaense]